jgi:hypothetical protein
MFALMGISGLLLAGALYGLHRDPRYIALTMAERAYLDEGGGSAAPVTLREWRRLFTFRTT